MLCSVVVVVVVVFSVVVLDVLWSLSFVVAVVLSFCVRKRERERESEFGGLLHPKIADGEGGGLFVSFVSFSFSLFIVAVVVAVAVVAVGEISNIHFCFVLFFQSNRIRK